MELSVRLDAVEIKMSLIGREDVTGSIAAGTAQGCPLRRPIR
jgi:hypothetical protein